MNSKQIVAALGAIALAFMVVYPAVATGTVSVSIGAGIIVAADHVYVTLTDVSAHRAGQSSDGGWEMIANQSRRIDLVGLQNSSTLLANGGISVSNYDMVRIDITNVTWVYHSNSSILQLESSQISANINFTVKAQKDVWIEVTLSGQPVNLSGTEYFSPRLTASLSKFE